MDLMMDIWILKGGDYGQISYAYLWKSLETFDDCDYCHDYCFTYDIWSS